MRPFVSAGRRRQSRRAFTLIELMVVVAVIGILAALLLPAIQAARRSARRTQCLNNMRNVGTGILNYVTHNTRFPNSGIWDPNPDGMTGSTSVPGIIDETDTKDPLTGWKLIKPANGNASSPLLVPSAAKLTPSQGRLGHSWVVEILTYIGKQDIHDLWSTGQPGSFGSYLDNDNTPSTTFYPSGNFGLSNDTTIGVLICPDDITAKESGRGHLSYVVNGGSGGNFLGIQDLDVVYARVKEGNDTVADETWRKNVAYKENSFYMGLMFLDSSTRTMYSRRRHGLDTLADGASQTVMLSENINAGYKTPDTSMATSYWSSNWACPHPFNTSFFMNPTAIQWKVGMASVGIFGSLGSTPTYQWDKANIRGEEGAFRYADPAKGFTEGYGINGTTPTDGGGINSSLSGLRDGGFPYPNSMHGGGVHVVMCDGAVRWVDDKINSAVWARLVTPAGSKIGRVDKIGTDRTTIGKPFFEQADGTGGCTQLPLGDGDY